MNPATMTIPELESLMDAVTRNEALRALGNGVCPPQAAAALGSLL